MPLQRIPQVTRHLNNIRTVRSFAQVTVSQSRLEQFVRAELSYFAQRKPQPLSLDTILHASTPAKVAKLVHAELPYRFAARIKHLESHEGWEKHAELVQLRGIFSDSFRDLRLAVPLDNEESSVSNLSEAIQALRLRHQPVVPLLAEAMRKMYQEQKDAESLQAWADTFLLSRISTEMLTNHFTAIVNASEGTGASEGSVGIVDTKCNPGQICEKAADQVLQECLGVDLRINVHTNNCSSSQGIIEFSYIPQYLFYIVQELLRNSVRATMEAVDASGNVDEIAKRPITVTVCADHTQVAIRISDQGGGVSFGNAQRIWSYVFSTSKQSHEDYIGGASPLSGWGMGLPLGRLYARYLGGSLELMNMPGIGVDAYLFFSKIAPAGDDLESSITSVSAPI